MKIAVFGGTGHASKYLVDELIAAGHSVRLLSRRDAPPRPQVERFVGDARSSADVGRVMEGCQVAVNSVGRLKNESGFYAAITSNILDNMAKTGVSRYVLVTNSTVRFPSDSATFFTEAGRWAFQLVFPHMMEDKQREGAQIAASGADWVVFRLPVVLDSPSGRLARANPSALRGWFVSNGAVAKAIVQEIDSPAYSRTAPFLFF